MNEQATPNQSKPVLYKRHAVAVVATLLVAAVFFGLTSPTRLPAIFFILAFMLIFAASYALVTGLVYLVAVVSGTLSQDRLRPRIRAIKAGTAAVTTVLLGLSSIGQLTVKDILTLLVFFSVLYFYATRLARK
jgi:hypothetical protein